MRCSYPFIACVISSTFLARSVLMPHESSSPAPAASSPASSQLPAAAMPEFPGVLVAALQQQVSVSSMPENVNS